MTATKLGQSRNLTALPITLDAGHKLPMPHTYISSKHVHHLHLLATKVAKLSITILVECVVKTETEMDTFCVLIFSKKCPKNGKIKE